MDEIQSTNAETTREFYLPATFQFTNEPGLIERFLGRLTRGGATVLARVRGDEQGTEFYLPATTRDAVSEYRGRPRPR